MLEVILLLLVPFIGSLLFWAFDPIIGYFDDSKLNLDDPRSWRTIDRYSEGKAVAASNSVDISLVFPAYNEEERLPITLEKTDNFMQKWAKERNITYEIIIVDDGSKDSTYQVAKNWYAKNRETYRIISLVKNQGKGGAVKVGVSEALGKAILMVDADGATEIEELDRLYSALLDFQPSQPDSLGMVLGSRAHLADKSVASRKWYRTILMKGFHMLVMLLCTRQVHDTQCGFKLFTATAAKTLFGNLHLYRWAFDIDIIYQAEAIGVPMKEMAVNWTEVAGSKLITNKWDIVTTSLTMARDMFCVRLAYLTGLWSLPSRSKEKAE